MADEMKVIECSECGQTSAVADDVGEVSCENCDARILVNDDGTTSTLEVGSY
jgi:DNA-directed RNA polymerase subunit RPC12/RpoP